MNMQVERYLLLAYPECDAHDDAALIRAQLAQLKPFTFRIEQVTSPAALLSALSNPPPHCILISDRIADDLEKLIIQLRTLTYPLYSQAVLIIGDPVDPLHVLRMMRAGASDYLPRRDLTPLRLMSAIENAVRQRDMEYALANDQRRSRQIDAMATQAHEQYSGGQSPIRAVRFDYNVRTGTVERSGGLYDVTGFTVEESEPIRDWWNARIHPDDRDRVLKEYDLNLYNADPHHDLHSAEYRIIHRSGRVVYVWSQSMLVRDETGKVVRVVGSVTDISERKRAEQELQVAQERYRLATDAVQAIIYDYDILSGTVQRSHGLTELLGYTDDDIDPSSGWWMTLVHPDDAEWIRLDTARVFNDPSIYQYDREYRVLHKDGHWKYVWDRAVYVRDANGVPIRIVGSTIDIDTQKRIALAEWDQRQFAEAIARIALTLNSTLDLPQVLEHILDTLSQVVPYDTVNIMLVRDRQARVVGMRGFDDAALVPMGEALRQLALPIDQHPDLDTMMRTHEPLIIPQLERHSNRASLIDVVPLQSYLGMVIAFGDEILGFLNLNSRTPAFFTVEHAARLKVFAAQAAQAVHNAIALEHAQELSMIKERQRIARDLHDSVSQLLFSAALLSETLMRVPNHPQFESNLEQLWRLNRGALAEMRNLVVEMRDVDTESFNLVEMLTQLANAAMGHADQLTVSLHVEGSVELPVKVRTTFYRITQEALNNVIKHAHAHQVRIQLGCDHDHAALTVIDDGQGFDPAQISWSSVGLSNIRERSRSIDAQSAITSIIGGGTTVRIEWTRPSRA